MIRIEMDDVTLSRTRIAISPLHELCCSAFLLQRNPAVVPWPYADWAGPARKVHNPGIDYFYTIADRSPDFLMPIPLSPLPTLDEQLGQLIDTPDDVIEQGLALYPGDDYLLPLRDRGFRAMLAEGLRDYWGAAIAPYWPAMRSALDEEVLLRARALAADGPDALLAKLHDRVLWERPILTLKKPLDQSFEAIGKRLLLVPLIFSRGALICSSDDPEIQMVTYQCRGAALLASAPAPAAAPDDRLTLLVGRGRAAVLRALRVPATTTALASTLGLAPSTVSEHLAGLQAAGVVHKRRAGRRVLYGLEPAGLALVTLLADDSGAAEFVS